MNVPATAVMPERAATRRPGSIITLENPAPHARTDWTTFTLPVARIPQGGLRLGASDAYLGSFVGPRLRRVHARVSIGALAREHMELTGGAPRPRLAPPESAAALGQEVLPWAVHLWINGGLWNPQVDISPDGPCAVVHARGRVPGSQFVGEFWAYVFPGARVVPWELLVVASDPTVTDVYAEVTSILLQIDGPVVVAPWWPQWRGARQIDANTVELVSSTVFGDTQGLAWAGIVATRDAPSAGAALHGPICAVASKGDWDGHWGPFGRLPESVSPSFHDYPDRLLRWHADTLVAGDVWRRGRLGLAPNSGDTGGQDDFGATKLGWAWEGGPLHVLEAYHSALQEACRPGQWREVDGAPAEPWNHPDHVTWDGYTHWHPSVSGDRMGKAGAATPRFTGGWIGPDREHWSNNLLCGAYLLTGSRLLQRVIEKQGRQILSGETVDPRLSTSHTGAPRGVGRTQLAASWIRRCLEPDGELLARVSERVAARLELIERETRPVAAGPMSSTDSPERSVYTLDGEFVRKLGATGAPSSEADGASQDTGPSDFVYAGALGLIDDPRAMGEGVLCVATWQEALGIVGLRAAALDGDANADTILRRVAQAWMEHAWWFEGGQWLLADYVAYLDPRERVRREGFEEWSTGALRVCASVLETSQAQRAAAILATMPCTRVAEAEWRATS